MRELANQTTTGERAGYGGGGVTALQAVIANVNRELTSLRKRQRSIPKPKQNAEDNVPRVALLLLGLLVIPMLGNQPFLKCQVKKCLLKISYFQPWKQQLVV